MIYTVGDMLPFVARKIRGNGIVLDGGCASDEAIEWLNKVTRQMLLEEKDLALAYVQIPVTGNTITLDSRIRSIITAKLGGANPMRVYSQAVNFIERGFYSEWHGGSCHEQLQLLGSQFPTIRDLDKPRVMFAVSDRPEDSGITMTVHGTDERNAELRTMSKTSGGSDVSAKGIEVPVVYATCDQAPQIACGDGYHRGLVKDITMIRKPVTNGYVDLWGLDELNGAVYWITKMRPDETSPSLTRYNLAGWRNACDHIYAQVYLRFEKMHRESDISIIQQPDALEIMTQAVSFYDVGDVGNGTACKNRALKLANREQSFDNSPDPRLNVQVSSMPLQGRNYSFRGMGRRRW